MTAEHLGDLAKRWSRLAAEHGCKASAASVDYNAGYHDGLETAFSKCVDDLLEAMRHPDRATPAREEKS